jgi:hypothetical protein
MSLGLAMVKCEDGEEVHHGEGGGGPTVMYLIAMNRFRIKHKAGGKGKGKVWPGVK